MDVREILVANTKTQKRYKVNTDATTLGELKAALDAQGIDYAGMTFTEGISKTQLTSDDSQLPTNVMYKGAPTNNLVMLLTNTTKNISSGAISRRDLFALIRENGLGDDLKEEFGNWTVKKTDELEDYIRENYGILDEDNNKAPETKNDEREYGNDYDEDEEWEDVEATHPDRVNCLYDYIKEMVRCNILDADDIFVLADLVDELAERLDEEDEDDEPEPPHPAEVSDEESNNRIDDILAGLN